MPLSCRCLISHRERWPVLIADPVQRGMTFRQVNCGNNVVPSPESVRRAGTSPASSTVRESSRTSRSKGGGACPAAVRSALCSATEAARDPRSGTCHCLRIVSTSSTLAAPHSCNGAVRPVEVLCRCTLNCSGCCIYKPRDATYRNREPFTSIVITAAFAMQARPMPGSARQIHCRGNRLCRDRPCRPTGSRNRADNGDRLNSLRPEARYSGKGGNRSDHERCRRAEPFLEGRRALIMSFASLRSLGFGGSVRPFMCISCEHRIRGFSVE